MSADAIAGKIGEAGRHQFSALNRSPQLSEFFLKNIDFRDPAGPTFTAVWSAAEAYQTVIVTAAICQIFATIRSNLCGHDYFT